MPVWLLGLGMLMIVFLVAVCAQIAAGVKQGRGE